MKTLIILLVTFLFCGKIFSQGSYLNFKDFYEKEPSKTSSFCSPYSKQNIEALTKEQFFIKYATKNWIYYNSTASKVKELLDSKELSSVYFEFAPPHALSDSALVKHRINLVHQGLGGIDTAYTGKGVIVGIVDQGIDFNHPDFKFSNGKTRVLRYWDHTINGSNPPQPYGYGTVWDSSAINNGTCTALETGTAHGTTVSGMAAGNAQANNKNKGAAPKADIIVVETNFNLVNWTLTIADACDYIFKVADSLGKPAVINLSLGTYLGSHDGNDPAADYMESLLDAQPGRLIVCAAGNSGNQGKYHVQGNNIDADTSFFWNVNNPGVTLAGTNKILFDLWSDTSDAHYYFAFGADRPSPTFKFRGRSSFHYATANMGSLPIYDTIYNTLNQRIACIETYREIIGSAFHMQVIFTKVDSLSYLYRFMTYGSGKYDAWGGSWQQLSNFVSSALPSTTLMPSIIHYHLPDSLQTIVSSWNCSEKIISVGNFRNRKGYIDKNNTYYVSPSTTLVGKLSENSSKGPSRLGEIKPDISAAGDITLAAGPMLYLANPANNSTIDQGGFHVRNGGTSMASPVVAGIGALYLEKCSYATWETFKTDLINSAAHDNFSGLLPNFGYGHGKADAVGILLEKTPSITISGPGGICVGSTAILSFSTNAFVNNVLWSNGGQTNSINTAIIGPYQVQITSEYGCKTKSPVHQLITYSLPFVDAGTSYTACPGEPITLSGAGTATSYTWANNIQNGAPFIPSQSSYYYVTGTNANNCQITDSIFVGLYSSILIDYTEQTQNVLTNSNPFNLTPGVPSGGTYSGNGIIGSSFHPTLAGVGSHLITYSYTDQNGCTQSDSAIINVVSGAAVSTLDSGNFALYPNPTDNDLILDLPQSAPSSTYQIKDATGRTLQNGIVSAGSNSISTKQLPAGSYFITLNYSIKKFIKI